MTPETIFPFLQCSSSSLDGPRCLKAAADLPPTPARCPPASRRRTPRLACARPSSTGEMRATHASAGASQPAGEGLLEGEGLRFPIALQCAQPRPRAGWGLEPHYLEGPGTPRPPATRTRKSEYLCPEETLAPRECSCYPTNRGILLSG